MGGCVSLPDNCVRLRTFRPLDDVELDVIALFQSLVTIQLDCRVVNENIWPVFTSDESVALGVVKPLHLAFVLSHRVLPFLPLNGVDGRMVWGTPTLPTMTRICGQRFIESDEKIHKMRQAGANCAPARAEDIELVDERDLRVLFLALFGDAPRIEQDTAESFAVLDPALFDHFDDLGELDEAEFDVLVGFGVGVAGHKAFS